MIPLTRLDGARFFLNAAAVLTIEETPDTVVHLTTGSSVMVIEGAEAIVELIVGFHHSIQLARQG